MVAPATPTLFGVNKPHYALPLLQRAVDDLQHGETIVAAARCREGLRRWLLHQTQLHACEPKLRTSECCLRMLRRRAFDKLVKWEFAAELVGELEDVLAFRRPGCSVRCTLECVLDLVAPFAMGDDWRDDDDGDGDVWKGVQA